MQKAGSKQKVSKCKRWDSAGGCLIASSQTLPWRVWIRKIHKTTILCFRWGFTSNMIDPRCPCCAFLILLSGSQRCTSTTLCLTENSVGPGLYGFWVYLGFPSVGLSGLPWGTASLVCRWGAWRGWHCKRLGLNKRCSNPNGGTQPGIAWLHQVRPCHAGSEVERSTKQRFSVFVGGSQATW